MCCCWLSLIGDEDIDEETGIQQGGKAARKGKRIKKRNVEVEAAAVGKSLKAA